MLRSRSATACAIALLLGGLHVWYLAFLCDDAFISFRYADKLASGQGLVFNAGERVEGYTNFLWVLTLAAGRRAGLSPDVLAGPLGASIALGTLAGASVLLARRKINPAPFAFLVAGCSGWAAWATGGLETSLFTALVTLAFFATLEETGPRGTCQRLTASSVLLALATLTRPEGILVAASFGVFLALRAWRGEVAVRGLVAWAAGWIIPYGLHMLWRYSYYGRFWPNTASVKTPGLDMLPAGLTYLGGAALRLHLYLLAIVLILNLVRHRASFLGSERSALAAVFIIPHLIFVAFAGGDFMDQYRFVVPVLPAFFFVVSGVIAPSQRAGTAGTVAFLTLWVILNAAGSRRSTEIWHEENLDSVGLLRKNAADWTSVGKHLRTVSQHSDVVAVTAAGCIPYYSGLHTIDQLGLTAPDLTLYSDRDLLRPGHRKLLRGDVLMTLRPQFVLGGPIVGESVQEARLAAWVDDSGRDAFDREYVPVGAEVDDPRGKRYYVMAVRRDVAERFR